MSSMSLEFILCTPERASPPHTRSQSRKNTEGPNAVVEAIDETTPSAEKNNQANPTARRGRKRRNNSKRSNETTDTDRQKHVRQLQNLRQRRYRERKKSTLSALEVNAQQLHLENVALETAILEHFKSQQ